MKNIKGFSMVELVIVLAICGILLVIFIPAFQNYEARYRVKGDESSTTDIEKVASQLEAQKSQLVNSAETFVTAEGVTCIVFREKRGGHGYGVGMGVGLSCNWDKFNKGGEL